MKIRMFFIVAIWFPMCAFSQMSQSLSRMNADPTPKFVDYEHVLYEATEYIFSTPVDFKSTEFASACKIVDFWKNRDTGVNAPMFGKFYNSLAQKSNQRYFYMIAIMNHILNEKVNKNRVLSCVKIEGQQFSEQDDVREVQIEGARRIMDYASNKNNNLELRAKSKKFLKAHKKGKLEEVFF